MTQQEAKVLKPMVSKVMITKTNKVGLVVDVSIAKSIGGGVMSGRDKVKCRYDAGFNSQAEAWFNFEDISHFTTVVKTVDKTKEEIDVEKIEKALEETKIEPWKEPEESQVIPENPNLPDEYVKELEDMQGEQLPEVIEGEDNVTELPEETDPPKTDEADFQG